MEIFNLFLEPIKLIVPKLPGAILNLIIGYILIRVINFIVKKLIRFLKFPKLRGIILSGINLFLWVLLITFIASSMGFGKLALAISSSAIVLVFFLNTGAAALISDIVSGLFLIQDPDFGVGMRVSIGSGDAKVEGIIKDIDMRKVRILDDKGNLHVFPNSNIEKNEWVLLEKDRKSSLKKVKELITKK